jgi:enoyl-[acyl-carrier-protein] reductase (NADH)
MSGIFSRTQYDECYSTEYKNINEKKYNYSLFLNYNVNPNMQTNMKVCVHNNNNKCFVCDLNKEATIDKTPVNFKKLTEIEGNLKGINRQLTYCNDKKFKGCFSEPESEECTNNIIINPQLCDREVTPTNMKKFDNILF